MRRAYVTLMSHGDGYTPGVEALGSSIRASGTREPMVAMVTADVSDHARARLASQGWQIRQIEPLHNDGSRVVPLFPRFVHTYTKLRAWQLTELDRVVLLDADTILLKNVDELFERPELSAAPDFLLPDRFNSGVMVLSPSEETFRRMTATLSSSATYDGGDQGFLNTFFGDWYAKPQSHRLPIGYNMLHFIYQFLLSHPGLRDSVVKEAKILHYAVQKPWRAMPQITGGSAIWWDMYCAEHPGQNSWLKRRVHALEDWTYDRIVSLFIG